MPWYWGRYQMSPQYPHDPSITKQIQVGNELSQLITSLHRCHRTQHVRSRKASHVGGDLMALENAFGKQERRMTLTSGRLKYQLLDQIESNINAQMEDRSMAKYDSFRYWDSSNYVLNYQYVYFSLSHVSRDWSSSKTSNLQSRTQSRRPSNVRMQFSQFGHQDSQTRPSHLLFGASIDSFGHMLSTNISFKLYPNLSLNVNLLCHVYSPMAIRYQHCFCCKMGQSANLNTNHNSDVLIIMVVTI